DRVRGDQDLNVLCRGCGNLQREVQADLLALPEHDIIVCSDLKAGQRRRQCIAPGLKTWEYERAALIAEPRIRDTRVDVFGRNLDTWNQSAGRIRHGPAQNGVNLGRG